MVAVFRNGAVDLYRRVGDRMLFWRRVTGTPEELKSAVEAARFLDLEAARVGGWGNALRLGLNPAKPVHRAGASSGVFLQDKLNGRLGKL
jgi:hypothetical protein